MVSTVIYLLHKILFSFFRVTSQDSPFFKKKKKCVLNVWLVVFCFVNLYKQ